MPPGAIMETYSKPNRFTKNPTDVLGDLAIPLNSTLQSPVQNPHFYRGFFLLTMANSRAKLDLAS